MQARLRSGAPERSGPAARSDSPLIGKLFDAAGDRLTPHHAAKGGRRYRYYVSRALVTGTAAEFPGAWRLPAGQVESLVATLAASVLAERSVVATALEKAGLPRADIPTALAEVDRCRDRLLSDGGRGEALRTVIDRVELGESSLQIVLSLASLVPTAARPVDKPACVLAQEFPIRIKRRGVEMKLVIDGPGAKATAPDPVLLKEIRRAHRCFDALISPRIGSVVELAAVEGVSDRYISSLLPLAFLAPDIIQAIATRNQPAELTAHRLIRCLDLPTGWAAQERLLGVA